MFELKSSENRLYFKNIKNLILGTAAAQIVMLISIPLLSRMYTSEDFGLLGIYIAFANIGRVVYCLRFDFSIQSTESDTEASTLVCLCVALGVISFCLCTTFLIIFPLPTNAALASVQYIVPFMILISSLDSVLGIWVNRLKLFHVFSLSRLVRAILIVTIQIMFFKVSNGGGGLLFGLFCGEIITIAFVVFMLKKNNIGFRRPSILEIIRSFRKNKNNPIYLLPGHSLNVAVAQLPIVIVGHLYGKESAGYIYIAQRIVSAPGQLVSNAIFKVYFSEGSSLYHATGSCYELAIATIRRITIPLTLIFLVIATGSIIFLEILLGVQWTGAKYIVAIYAMSEIIPAIFHPVSATWFITNNQKLNLRYQIYRAGIISCALLTSIWFEQILYFVAAYGFARTLSYLIFLTKCISLSKGTERTRSQ